MNHEIKKLKRSRNDRMVFGLCGGLAKYFELDSTLMRGAFILVSMAGGAGILAYILMSLITPLEEGSDKMDIKDEAKAFAEKVGHEVKSMAGEIKKNAEPTENRERIFTGRTVFGLLFIALGVAILVQAFAPFYHMYFRALWPVLFIVFGFFLVVKHK